MKKVLMIIAVVATMLAVAACGNNQSAQESAAEATECCEGDCENCAKECEGECENCAKECEGECECEECAQAEAAAEQVAE